MMVTVSWMVKRNGHWTVERAVECSEKDAPQYVKMFFDLGAEKVRVG